MTTYFTSRSRIEAQQKCPRYRYLGSDYNGLGLETTKLSLPLTVGSAVHKGVEIILSCLKANQPQQTVQEIIERRPSVRLPLIVDEGVTAALDEFEQAYITREIDATANESTVFIHDEHAALIEGLLRLWAVHPDGLPWLLSEYEVLEVEKWDTMPLVEDERAWAFTCPDCSSEGGLRNCVCGSTKPLIRHEVEVGGITLRSRADALLRKRSDGSLYVWSLKTANAWDKRKENEARHDVQGISEMVCIEHRLDQERKFIIENRPMQGIDTVGERVRIDGTQMTHFIKGRRELDEDNNVYRIKSVLLHPWARANGLLGELEFAHTYYYNCELPHPFEGRKGQCEGGKRHSIGNSWEQVNIWEYMPMAEWVQLLLSGMVQPSLPLPAFFINPIPAFRNDEEVKDWLEQITHQERVVLAGLSSFGDHVDRPEDQHRILNECFPQHRRSCDWPGKCQFIDICFGPLAIADDPVGSGLFVLRTPVDHTEIGNDS